MKQEIKLNEAMVSIDSPATKNENSRKNVFISRKIVRFILFGTLLFVLVGCEKVKTLPPIDKNVADEECATLLMTPEVNIKRINGKRIRFATRWASFWLSGKISEVLIPTGEHEITFSCYSFNDGYAMKNVTCNTTLETGKTYMISAAIDKEPETRFFVKAFNYTASYLRDQLVELVPLMSFFPRKELPIIYSFDEFDYEMLDSYFIKLKENKESWWIILLSIITSMAIAMIWLVLFWYTRLLSYNLFMSKLKNKLPFVTLLLCIILVAGGILVINYNTDGRLLLYIVATLLLGIGLAKSEKDMAAEGQ